MRLLPIVLLLPLLLFACAPQDRIYDASEIDEPPTLVGDSLIIEAPALPDTSARR